MKKKFITLLLCAAVGIGALSGCGGNTSAKELPEDSVAADITVDKESLPPVFHGIFRRQQHPQQG